MPALSDEHLLLCRSQDDVSPSERKKIAADIGLVVGQKEPMCRHLLSYKKADVEVHDIAGDLLMPDGKYS